MGSRTARRLAALSLAAALGVTVQSRAAPPPQPLVSQAIAAVLRDDDEAALKLLDRAVAEQPTSEAHHLRAELLFAVRGDLDAAVAEIDRALALKPQDMMLLGTRASYRITAGQAEAALPEITDMLRRDPQSKVAHGLLGRAYFLLHHYPEAADELSRSVALGATGAYAVLDLHVARRMAGQDDAQELAVNAARVDASRWPGPIVAYHQGRISASAAMKAAESGPASLVPRQRCTAAYHVGLGQLWTGDVAGANVYLERVARTCRVDSKERALASATLAHLAGGAR